MKKRMLVMLCLAMSVTLLAGCGSTEEKANESGGTDDTAAVAKADRMVSEFDQTLGK